VIIILFSNKFYKYKLIIIHKIIQGGGDAGSYEAGALMGLIGNLSPEEVQYDVNFFLFFHKL